MRTWFVVGSGPRANSYITVFWKLRGRASDVMKLDSPSDDRVNRSVVQLILFRSLRRVIALLLRSEHIDAASPSNSFHGAKPVVG